jgi:hypothetical protein
MVLTFAVSLTACASHPPAASPARSPPPVITIYGTPGAAFSGYYVVNGERSKFSGVAPAQFEIAGLSQIAIAKVRSEDELTVVAKYALGTGQMTSATGQNIGILFVLDNSFVGSPIPPEAIRSPADNELIVIKPYWFEGTWVFDDDSVGLRREPFIKGVPEMIDELVKDIPDSRQGFRLTCSEHEFPGYQRKLIWVRAENGGNFYRIENPNLQGWLCPAMFRYFSQTPRTLYVEAEAIRP